MSVVVERLESLRELMRRHGVHACVVPTSDPHLSEYLPQRWQTREWLSGFTGSAGTLVVCLDDAALWTDSRYWEQAEAELKGTGIRLMQAGKAGVSAAPDWTLRQVPKDGAVSIDGQVFSVQGSRQWHEACRKAGVRLIIDHDLVGRVWLARPEAPKGSIVAHEAPWACRTRNENLAAVRSAMMNHDAQWHLISALDDIAWLFNLRGNDVSYNPVFLSHALIGASTAEL